ncbi:MAG: hypothetical protein L3J71_15850 [Victivallaceae bacterium]|nr:hypothetical protein [Victivallaceae bacterium]
MNNNNGQSALPSAAAKQIYGAHGGFRKLKAYQVAELCYDFTCRFCERYVPRRDRHFDQMVQAARSGYQNIGGGSEDSATSTKPEQIKEMATKDESPSLSVVSVLKR